MTAAKALGRHAGRGFSIKAILLGQCVPGTEGTGLIAAEPRRTGHKRERIECATE